MRGRLIVSEPVGWEHGAVVARISFALALWLREATPFGSTPVGEDITGDAGFWIARDPDTVRAPDIAFIAADRLPAGRLRGFLENAPSLAVEVISPTDRPGAVLAKVSDWLEDGRHLSFVRTERNGRDTLFSYVVRPPDRSAPDVVLGRSASASADAFLELIPPRRGSPWLLRTAAPSSSDIFVGRLDSTPPRALR